MPPEPHAAGSRASHMRASDQATGAMAGREWPARRLEPPEPHRLNSETGPKPQLPCKRDHAREVARLHPNTVAVHLGGVARQAGRILAKTSLTSHDANPRL